MWRPTETKKVKYKKSKYSLVNHVYLETGAKLEKPIKSYCGMVEMSTDGLLHLLPGFIGDPSGPTIDTKSTIMAGFGHDGLYLLHREGKLPMLLRKTISDPLLKRLMIRDGAWEWRANYWLWSVNKFGRGSARKQQEKIYTAP
jgi:hypothetical protein